MKRRRTSRAPARVRRNFSVRSTLRDIDHLMSQAEDELASGHILNALTAYMMGRDLACSLAGQPLDAHSEKELRAISQEMAMVMDEIGDQLREAGVR